MHRGHAERQMGECRPVLLGHDQVLGVGSVGMGVDESGNDGLPAEVVHHRVSGNGDIRARQRRCDCLR